jgi:integrase
MEPTPRRSRRFGTIRQLRSGRFQARWRSPDGTLNPAPDTFDTFEQADKWLAGVHVKDRRVGRRQSAKLLGEFVEADWRPSIVHLRASTLKRDLAYIDLYILPAFAETPLERVDYPAVAAWVSDLRARGLAPGSVVKAAQILAKVCDAAVKAGRMEDNPVRKVKLPRVERVEFRALDPAEVERLADAIDARYRPLVVVACHTGLRFGELAALVAGDVDLMRRRLNVSRNVVDLGVLAHSNVKTAAGHRSVPLDAAALEALWPLVAGRHPDDLIFEAPQGGHMRLNSWRQRFWRPATKAAGLDGLRVHDMRHTAVSIWLRAGTDPKAVATWAGHRSVVTVLDRYAHQLPDHADEHLARLDAYVAAHRAAPSATIHEFPERSHEHAPNS